MGLNKYTIEQVRAEFLAWCADDIGVHTMSRRQYNAMKRRTCRYGFKKPFYKLTVLDRKLHRRDYMRLYRAGLIIKRI
jgi:hypothetical protein